VKGAIVALDIEFLLSFAGLDMFKPNAVFLGLYHQGPTYVFWALVDRYGLGFTAPLDELVQALDNAFCGQRDVHFNAQGFTIEVIQIVQNSNRPAIGELVHHEVPSCLMILAVPMRSWNSCPARHLCQAAAEVGPFPSWSLWTVAE
jgi:hypothetical protein